MLDIQHSKKNTQLIVFFILQYQINFEKHNYLKILKKFENLLIVNIDRNIYKRQRRD